MVINALYRKYFQKSKIFIYPLLDIKRGTQIVPSETYLAWNDTYFPEDRKLICIYDTDQPGYEDFEKTVILKHTRLHEYVKVDSSQSVCVFDFSDLGNDWDSLIDGKYSKINEQIKRKIVNFFDKNSGNHVYVTSYMFPESFFKRYAELLDVPVALLEEAGELCDKPNLEKEKLLIEVADFENINKSKLSL
jgi:hypothetical protein